MALPKDPYVNFNFHVEIDGIVRAAFHEASGLDSAIDVIEHPERGLLVNEVNHTMEFHTTQPICGIDIADLIAQYVLAVSRGKV